MKKIKFYNSATNKYFAMTKADIAFLLDKVAPLSCMGIIYNHFTYKELVETLHRQLSKKQPTYLELIKWEDYI